MKSYRSQIAVVLQEYGPMTAIEVAEMLGIERLIIHRAIASARFQKPGELFRVVAYRATGKWRADDAVFDYGPGVDLPRKPFTGNKKISRRKAATKRYREKASVERNVKNRLYKAARAGREIVINPWAQLAPPEVRGTMGRQLIKKDEE